MSSFILENKVELSQRHYIRKAKSSSRWFDFSMGKLNRYKQRFNGDFCLVVNCDEISDNAYILPYQTIASMLTEDTLKNEDTRAPRWMGTIDGNHLLKLTPLGLTMDLSQYHNAYHLLRGTMAKAKIWTRDELILTINLYCKIPFGKIDMRTPEVIQLAKRLGRTPGSISYKLANFASIDPTLPRKGASNVSKLDKKVWQEFFNNWDDLIFSTVISSP